MSQVKQRTQRLSQRTDYFQGICPYIVSKVVAAVWMHSPYGCMGVSIDTMCIECLSHDLLQLIRQSSLPHLLIQKKHKPRMTSSTSE